MNYPRLHGTVYLYLTSEMMSKHWIGNHLTYYLPLICCGEAFVVRDDKDGLRSRAYKVIEELLLLSIIIEDGMIPGPTRKTFKRLVFFFLRNLNPLNLILLLSGGV
jgi:hypothetical protein